MFDTAILILLYNKEINVSTTIHSLVNSEFQYAKARLVIWNNGPAPLKSYDCTCIETLGYDVIIEETLNNESLAAIYNRFLDGNSAKKYILLDDDSDLNPEYVFASSKIKTTEVGMPMIFSQGVICAPTINNKPYTQDVKISIDDEILTIGSGLVIGEEILTKITQKYERVFDERFFLYGVDTSFCLRLFESKWTHIINVIPGFNHSLSRLQDENLEKSKFRRLERSYSAGLELRYYYSLYKALISILDISLGTVKKIIFRQKHKINLFYFFKAILTGKHYRMS
jgi:hypothetical protein